MLTKEFLVIASTVVAIGMVIAVNFIRIKNSNKPVTSGRKIILPPMFMATGAVMYLLPMFRPTFVEAVGAILGGMFFSIFLIKTSKFEIRDNQIFMRRSKLFFIFLIGLVAIRMIGKIIVADAIQIDPGQMAGMFFLLAFSMILPWRIGMYLNYNKIKKQHQEKRLS